MERNIVHYDLESYPIQIKTDSKIGSRDYIQLNVYSKINYIGFINIQFHDPMTYQVMFCSGIKQFLTPPPEESEKIWTITKNSTNLKISCNKINVLNLNFSGNYGNSSMCESNWSQEVSSHKDTFLPT